MKTRYFIIAMSLAGLFFSCDKTPQREIPAPDGLVTISVTIPDDATRGGAGEKTTLSWTWSSGDKLAIVGETTEIFNIKPGFTPKKAEFTGTAVKGDKFSIYYPEEGADAADWSAQVQKGNNNTAHLSYTAALVDVDNYLTFSFSPEWAEEHGGSLSQVGVLKFVLTPPAGVTNVTSVSVSTEDALLYSGNGETKVNELALQLQNVTLAAGEDLVAWMETSWNEAVIPASTPLTVKLVADGMTYKQALTKASDVTIKSGVVNVITIAEASRWQDDTPLAGSGTETDPWVIMTRGHLLGMEASLAAGETRCFKLGADIDLNGVSWSPVSCADGKKIVFDGANHTISHLGASLFDVLDGTVKNLVIDAAAIDGGSAFTGALLKKNPAGIEATVKDVQLKNSTISASAYTGGLIGEVDGPLTISGVKVTGTNVSGTLCGGIIGFANSVTDMDDCSYEDGTVTASARYAGSIAGSIGKFAAVFTNCTAKNAVVNSSADRVGGAFGQIAAPATVTKCKVENVSVKGSLNVAGFVGVCYSTVTNSSVSGGSVSCTGTAADAQIGGFAAYPENATITNCYTTASVNGGTCNKVGGFIGRCMGGCNITYCYEKSAITGTGTVIGAFIGSYEVATTNVTKCIAWDGTLAFDSVKDGVSDANVTGNYIGTDGTITTQAQGQGWSSDIWDFSGSEPKLK